MKNRILAFALVLALVVGIVPAYAAGATFSDVPSTHWAYQDVEAAVADGVLNGIGGGRFNPGGKLTIAEWSCILARGFYAEEVEAKTKTSWYNREMETLTNHAVFAGMFDEIRDVSAYAPRSLMAAMVRNVLSDKGVKVSAGELEPFKAAIADLDAIPAKYQDAVATCWALGIINGVGGGRFDGGGTMQRDAAAVYNRTKKALQNGRPMVAPGIDPVPTPSTEPQPTPSTPVTPPVTGSVVGTISTEKVTINKDSIKTHAPITDYWSNQPAEIQAIADKDSFNAAAQTIHDSEMILTQGQLTATGINQYYNYAVIANNKELKTVENVDKAMDGLSGCGGSYGSYGSSYRMYLLRPLRTTTTSAPRFAAAIASITHGMTNREKAEICVNAVCDQISYGDGGASWDNGGTSGYCESYARMTSQILSAAGIPNIHMNGVTKDGNHAWVQIFLPDEGQWFIIDSVSADVGYDKIVSLSWHEQHWGYSHSVNDSDSIKVAKALVELFF